MEKALRLAVYIILANSQSQQRLRHTSPVIDASAVSQKDCSILYRGLRRLINAARESAIRTNVNVIDTPRYGTYLVLERLLNRLILSADARPPGAERQSPGPVRVYCRVLFICLTRS
ncbi:MAG: hypothetical protein HKN81_10715 [Gammaproteobacteria bacterium]|nr:hypothetical protein [Gammaproteobacteria bacterium]